MRLSDTEWKIMAVLWQRHPASAREILEQLKEETGWAYSTVKTLLTRLAEKGAVQVEKRGNTRWFEPLITQRKARQSALRSLLDRAFEGTFGSLVHHLAQDEELTDAEKNELLQLADLPSDDEDSP